MPLIVWNRGHSGSAHELGAVCVKADDLEMSVRVATKILRGTVANKIRKSSLARSNDNRVKEDGWASGDCVINGELATARCRHAVDVRR